MLIMKLFVQMGMLLYKQVFLNPVYINYIYIHSVFDFTDDILHLFGYVTGYEQVG